MSAGAPLPLWGRVRPARGADGVQVQIEFAPAGTSDFQPVGDPIAVTDQRGVFQTTLTASRSGAYRFRWLTGGGGGRTRAAGGFTSAAVSVVVASR